MSRRRAPKAPQAEVLPPLAVPALPPKTPAELAASDDMLARMRELRALLRERNLNSAVALAQQAACGHGPLIDHFCELGRRWAFLLDAPLEAQQRRRSFEMIEGGRS